MHPTDGELAKLYPDQIRTKRTAASDKSRLEKHVYPVIGEVPINRLTLDDFEGVMRSLPTALTATTRRHIGQVIARVMRMAVYPLRLIATNPIPEGFLPSSSKAKAHAYLYPDEDRRLLSCTAVPLAYRVLWGFLTREGMRIGEALGLTWADLQLERDAIRLDKNSESWIGDRTGHKSSQMIARYKRTARTFAELEVGEFASMAAAIPELNCHGIRSCS